MDRTRSLQPYELFLEEIRKRGLEVRMHAICHHHGVRLDEIYHRNNVRNVRRARVRVWLWLLGGGWNKQQVARLFGRHRSTVVGVLDHWQSMGRLG